MTITLRNISPELARKLKQKAQTQGRSLSKVAMEFLEKGMGLRKSEPMVLHHDLDSLAGTWTKEETRTFERSLREQRSIDPDPWR
jgi:plasmid stability protein